MENKFCLKTREQLDEIRKAKAQKMEEAKTAYPKGKQITKAEAKKLALAGKSFIVAKASDKGIAYKVTDFEDMVKANKEKGLDKKDGYMDKFKKTVEANFDSITKSEFEGNPKLIYFAESKMNQFGSSVNILVKDTNNYGEVENLEFELVYDGTVYYVECYAPDLANEDYYVIRVYKTEGQQLNNETEVAKGYTDSTGGVFDGDELEFYDYKNDYSKLTQKIMDVILSNLKEVVSHKQSESKINEISDKTINRALAKRHIRDDEANWGQDVEDNPDYNYGLAHKYDKMKDLHRRRTEKDLEKKALKKQPDNVRRLSDQEKKDISYKAYLKQGRALRKGIEDLANEKDPEALAYKARKKARLGVDEVLTAREALAKSKAILEEFNNSSEEPTFWGYATDMPEVELPKSAVLQICHSGDNADDVDEVKEIPMVKAQIDKWTDEEIDGVRHQLDMTDEEFNSLTKDEKISYIIWIAAWNIFEDEEYYDELHEKLKKGRKKEAGFPMDGAETLDQVYQRNWNRVMSRMNAKNEDFNSDATTIFLDLLNRYQGALKRAMEAVDNGKPIGEDDFYTIALKDDTAEQLYKYTNYLADARLKKDVAKKVETVKNTLKDIMEYTAPKAMGYEFLYDYELRKIVKEIYNKARPILRFRLKPEEIIGKILENPNIDMSILDKSDEDDLEESLKINEESYTKEEAVDVNGRPLKAGVVYKINNAAVMKFTGEFNELNMPLFQPVKGKTYTQEMSPYNSFEPITNKSESLTEDDNKIKFHDELNPKLWENFELKSDVKSKLNEIAEAFKEYLDIPEEAIQDVRITGSSASYNYTKYSDLDLHLIVDYEKIHEDCPLVEGYLWSYKSAFNRDHDISIYGVPVEVYAEDSKSEAISNGVYSLKEDKWLKKPEKIEPLNNGADVQAKFQELREAVEKCDDSEVAEQLLDKIYKMRKSGLEEVGEFSTENMAFKLLRNEGYMDKLKNLKKEQVDKKLSLESLKRKPTRLTKMTEKADYVYELVHKKTGRTIWSHTRRMPGYTFTGKKLENKPEYSDTTKKYWNESKINEISDELANKALRARVKDAVKANYADDKKNDKELKITQQLIKRKKRQGKKLTNDEKEYLKKKSLFKESKINEANEDAKIKIFLTNLGKYNEGDLVGEWVELPVDDFQPILDRIGINDEYEEWFITDYEAPFEIGEYDDIYELNEVAEAIENFSDTELEVLEAFKDNGYDMKEAIEKVADNEYTYIEGNTEEDLAYGWIDMIGSFDDAVKDEDKSFYFDYEAFGRDLVLGGDYTRVDDAVDLSQFPDRDTAEMVFGSHGEDKPIEEELAEFEELLDLANQMENLEGDELAQFEEEHGVEKDFGSIYKEGVFYDIETMQMIVDKDYTTESGYSDMEGNIIDAVDEKALAEYVIDDIYGGPQELPQDELERYFDYGWFGKTLSYDFYRTDNGWVDVNY